MAAISYPLDVDFVKSARDVLAFVRGGGNVKDVAKDAWVVAGFALGKTVGEPSLILNTAAAAADPADTLEKAIASCDPSKAQAHALPPGLWMAVLKIALDVLSKFLST